LAKGFFQYEEGITRLERHFKVASLEAFDCSHWPLGLRAAAAALTYAKESKRSDLEHLVKLEPNRFDRHMALDAATLRNLEILKPLHGDDEDGTLFALIDRTSTALGARCLKRWLTHPLLDRDAITLRQDAISELMEKSEVRKALRQHLQGINDIERIVAKCGAARAHARDLLGLSQSLAEAARVAELVAGLDSTAWKQAATALAPWAEFASDLAARLTEKPPLTVREGGMIRAGAYAELDALVDGIRDGREWLNNLQDRERKATGITTLKVGYNKVFGYYLEVTKAQEDKVPPHYLRKQSLVNAERFITPEMKEWENRILSAESEINGVEYRLFCELRDGVKEKAADLLAAAAHVAEVDTLHTQDGSRRTRCQKRSSAHSKTSRIDACFSVHRISL
jgi:DNA mismatch repair protein MutS